MRAWWEIRAGAGDMLRDYNFTLWRVEFHLKNTVLAIGQSTGVS